MDYIKTRDVLFTKNTLGYERANKPSLPPGQMSVTPVKSFEKQLI